MAGHDRLAAGWSEHRTQDPERRSLARAVGSEQAEDRAGLAVERNVRDRVHPAPLVVEKSFSEPFDVDHEGDSRRDWKPALGGRSIQAQPADNSARAGDGSWSIYS